MFSKDLPEHWENFEKMAKGQIPIYMDPEKHHTRVGHGDIAVQIVTTIATNRTQEFHVNIPNRGCITNLPHGAIVEVPALVDRSGIRPLCMGDLPKGVVGLTSALINWQELSVDAALSGNKDTLMQALLAHPWMRIISLQDARMLGEEMLASHEKHLPQFL
jgi:alpha-galactosidase/6-phospho-beta-glucosidase family protein